MCKAYTSCWLVVPRHQTSAASLREIIFDVIKKLLSCCGWYTSHKAVTSIQPNAPPWISLLTPCTALKDACSIYVIWPELFVSAHYARHKPFLSIPLWLYFLNTPPPPIRAEFCSVHLLPSVSCSLFTAQKLSFVRFVGLWLTSNYNK